MTDPRAGSESPERLDEETERQIIALPRLAQALMGHENVKILPLGELTKRANAYESAENALRSRIRQLVEEARIDAAQNVVSRVRAGGVA